MKKVSDNKLFLYPEVKPYDKYFRSISLILSQSQEILSCVKKQMLFQFWHFSILVRLRAYFQYDWYISPIPISYHVLYRVCHHAEVRLCMGNLYFHLINFILLFYSGVQLEVHLIYKEVNLFKLWNSWVFISKNLKFCFGWMVIEADKYWSWKKGRIAGDRMWEVH